MSKTSEFANILIQRFGDQAYHKAMEMTIECYQKRQLDRTKQYADAALALIMLGYHRKPKASHVQTRTSTAGSG